SRRNCTSSRRRGRSSSAASPPMTAASTPRARKARGPWASWERRSRRWWRPASRSASALARRMRSASRMGSLVLEHELVVLDHAEARGAAHLGVHQRQGDAVVDVLGLAAVAGAALLDLRLQRALAHGELEGRSGGGELGEPGFLDEEEAFLGLLGADLAFHRVRGHDRSTRAARGGGERTVSAAKTRSAGGVARLSMRRFRI